MRTPGVFLSADALAEALDMLHRLAALVPERNPAETRSRPPSAQHRRPVLVRAAAVRLHQLLPRRLPRRTG